MDAIEAVDDEQMRKLVDQCLREARIYPLRVMQLERCGEFVARQQREYEKTLSDLGKAKAPKKIDDMEQQARRAGSNLCSAVHQMIHRAKSEVEERQLFFVDDLIIPPVRFNEHMCVHVSYRWRKAPDEDWTFGSVTFVHEVQIRPDYSMPQPKRKPSAAKREQERQEKLWRVWDHLKKIGLYSVREFLRNEGNGADIPKTFEVIPDSYDGALNNNSAKFWGCA